MFVQQKFGGASVIKRMETLYYEKVQSTLFRIGPMSWAEVLGSFKLEPQESQTSPGLSVWGDLSQDGPIPQIMTGKKI